MMKIFGSRKLVAYASLTVCLVAFIVYAWYWLYRDTTVYASGFSEEKFSRIEVGMPREAVDSLLGPPLHIDSQVVEEKWLYYASSVSHHGDAAGASMRTEIVLDRNARVSRIDLDLTKKARVDMTVEQLLDVLGAPSRIEPIQRTVLSYSSPGGEVIFRGRAVELSADGHVRRIIKYQFHD